jgi:hypothetical protein
MSDGNVHVGDVETLVETQDDGDGGAPAGPAPAADAEMTRKTMERLARDRARTRAWGFDD